MAQKYNLKVIYDAAHCFGVTYKGKSIFEYGDVSTCSFHATKLFHTGEGGAIFTKSQTLIDKLFYHHNFGHFGPEVFQGVGINAKMSELQAAMGLAVLPYMQKILEARKGVVELYKNNLKSLGVLKLREETHWNYSYYPVLFNNETQLFTIQKLLNKGGVIPRRYFYPSLNLLPYTDKKSCPTSENIASRVLCLPLYHDLSKAEVLKICTIINEGL